MLTRKRKMEGFEEMKKLFEGLAAQLKTGQDKLSEEMKANQDKLSEEMKSNRDEMRANKEEMKAEIKAAQDKLTEDLKSGQEELKDEMKEQMNASQEEMKKEILSVKDTLKENLLAVENRLDSVEVKVKLFEDKITGIEENIYQKIEDKFEQKIESNIQEKIEESFDKKVKEKIEKNFDKKVKEKIEEINQMKDTFRAEIEENMLKIKNFEKQKLKVTANEEIRDVSFTSKDAIKLSTYDGKSSWEVYRTQFEMVAEANGWSESAKALHLAASLRGDAAIILQTLTEEERHNFAFLSKALDLRFGEKCSKEYSRLQLKSRYQKASESLEELAADIQRLSLQAYSDCPVELRQHLALQNFIDGVRDMETQKALRLADVKDIGAALVYAHKIEAAQQATRKDRHFIRAASVNEGSELEQIKKNMAQLTRELRQLQTGRQERNLKFRCWSCGREGHVRKNCPVPKDGGDHHPPQEGNC